MVRPLLVPRGRPDDRPIPPHPYRDTALVYAGMAVVLLVVATLTGSNPLKASLVAAGVFVLATAWSWWRFRIRINERDAALAAAAAAGEAAGGKRASANGNGRRGGSG